MIDICGCTKTLRLLFLQILRPFNHGNSSTYIFNMHILIKSLRSTKTGRITQTQVDILRRIKAQIGTWAKNDIIYHIMFIETSSDQNTPAFILPLILQEGAVNIHCLIRMTIVSPHIIFQPVTVVFKSRSEIGRHEKTFIKRMYVLGTPHSNKVCCLSVCFERVIPGTVITVTVCIGSRREDTQTILFIW